ncbi:hypothetical protein CCAND95_420010 [Capnocytophaga canis]|uniref:Uncharacterized protein n=1 Tax=Capnocytophaga canis TaxID=1848903 RepID=A0A0B7I1F0_9FLAO|nr:hypothetical protein CCAND95_420010 [Capnocytophaga canis]CEN45397.1 hypothetical protein CCAND38_240022 [Capnocytophaga canis]
MKNIHLTIFLHLFNSQALDIFDKKNGYINKDETDHFSTPVKTKNHIHYQIDVVVNFRCL